MQIPLFTTALLSVVQLALATINVTSFLTDATAQYLVKDLPDLDVPLGKSYAGLMPISTKADENRKLFFWFFPTENPAGTNELTIWFTGGPGCSGLLAVLQENGPFIWYPGVEKPVVNPWSISHLTSVLYVDQPIGTGFSVGTPDITDEKGLATEFLGFYSVFRDKFGLDKAKTYISGESYAGYYALAIADAMIDAEQNTKTGSDHFQLKGVSLHSALIGDIVQQQEVTTLAYAEYWNNLIALNDTTMTKLRSMDKHCTSTAYFDKWFNFPAKQQPIPLLPSLKTDTGCDLTGLWLDSATQSNPCFNVYHITDTCPVVANPIPNPNGLGASTPGSQNYFDRADVKAAIHAPSTAKWTSCVRNVFVDDTDKTQTHPPASDGTLQRVIEYTNNTMIGSGDLDATVRGNDTLLVLQNVTWNGHQGFESWPANKFIVPAAPGLTGTVSATGAGIVGTWATERGLTFFRVAAAGHQIWQYAPAAAYRQAEVFYGRVKSLGDGAGWTTGMASG